MKYSKAVIITLITKGGAIVLGLLSSIIIARYLGPSGRDALSVLAALVGGAVQFGGLGLNGSVLYFGSRAKNEVPQIVWNVFISATLMGVVVATGYLLIGVMAPSVLIGDMEPAFLFALLPALPFAFYTQFCQSLLVSAQRVVEYNALDLLSRAIAVVGLVLVLVALRLSTSAAVWSFTATVGRALFRGDGQCGAQVLFIRQRTRLAGAQFAGIDANILRLAAFELLQAGHIAPAIVINEAIEIAKKYSGTEAATFVNGILDALRKKIQAKAAPEQEVRNGRKDKRQGKAKPRGRPKKV